MDELILNRRLKKTANEAKQKRREGKVPGVVYGKKLGGLMFEIGEMELVEELSKVGEHGAFKFDLEGYNGTAIVKEVQKDPVSHKVIHIDLEEVNGNKILQTEVPIRLEGKEFLSKKGIVIQNQRESVKISCKAEDVPKSIGINVAEAKIGSVYKLSDLEVGSEISILDNLSSVFASVVTKNYSAEEVDEK
ncbi:50S ribosomal protein L25 [Clostridium sp. C2-6-12]|uniref:50S ribosomal protein L25 n=1 Tax=Clostridium sp. C2-6-12 TaxID=2698832 RepID=UPI00136B878A|nr:50S ribosomal protein L25 [Clostridium sp. C2-6-12]